MSLVNLKTLTQNSDRDNKYCLEPLEGGCSPVDKTQIFYRPTSSKCQDELPTNCLSVFDHFVGLALKGLREF